MRETLSTRCRITSQEPLSETRLAAHETSDLDDHLAQPRRLELVRLRTGQLLGFTEGIEAHARKLLHLGDSMGRIGQVYWWQESSLFSERDKIALSLGEAIVLFEPEIVKAMLAGARDYLSLDEIVCITLAVSAILDWKDKPYDSASGCQPRRVE